MMHPLLMRLSVKCLCCCQKEPVSLLTINILILIMDDRYHITLLSLFITVIQSISMTWTSCNLR